MAFVPLQVISPNIQIFAGQPQAIGLNCLNAAGAALDVSGYFLLKLSVKASVNGQLLEVATSTWTSKAAFSTPTTTFTLAASDITAITALPQGQYTYELEGEPASGDTVQAIARGNLSVAA
jgi:hypothetical protein